MGFHGDYPVRPLPSPVRLRSADISITSRTNSNWYEPIQHIKSIVVFQLPCGESGELSPDEAKKVAIRILKLVGDITKEEHRIQELAK